MPQKNAYNLICSCVFQIEGQRCFVDSKASNASSLLLKENDLVFHTAHLLAEPATTVATCSSDPTQRVYPLSFEIQATMAQTTRCSRNNANLRCLVGLVILLMCFTQVQNLITFQFGAGMQLTNSLSVPNKDASNEVSTLLVSPEKNLSSNAHHDTNPQELVEEPPAPLTLLQNQNTTVTCAINLYGLPRAFHSIVLPSLIQNVISKNPTCDYFMHLFNITEEKKSRSGVGGKLASVESIMSALKAAVHAINPHAIVDFAIDTIDTYSRKRENNLIHNVTNTMLTDDYQVLHYKGNPRKVPHTVWNILKMWHSQESVWDLMNQSGTLSNKKYEYVAMMRNDVLYATPITILDQSLLSNRNRNLWGAAVLPGFGKYAARRRDAVSDRMIYGPYDAVAPWATNRLSRIFEKMQKMKLQTKKSADAGPLHSQLGQDENYLTRFILPVIKERGFEVVEHPTLCFMRARADETVWISDCFINTLPSITKGVIGEDIDRLDITKSKRYKEYVERARKVVEGSIRRSCCGKVSHVPSNPDRKFYHLPCPRNSSSNENTGC